jgi:C2 domain of PTEN tumour-suppressor protein
MQAEPLLLRRVIMNTIPRFGTRNADGSSSSDSSTSNSDAAEGCCPYIQVFKGGRLVFTTTYVPSHDTRHTPHAITAAASTDTSTAATATAATTVPEGDQQGSATAVAGDSSNDSTAAAVAEAGAASATANTTAAAENTDTTTAADSSSSSASTAAKPPATATDTTTTGTAAATTATPTAAAAATAGTALPWAYTSDESIAFSVDCVVQGDLLLRCRHLGPSGQRVSMFRAAFHTGYVPCGVLRLSKAQLDGACGDPRFDEVSHL